MFQISNQSTLGESEGDIVDHLVDVVTEVAEHEQNARTRLAEQRRIHLIDHVARALAVLRSALVLSSEEAMDLLSALRLGVEMGIVHSLSVGRINDVMLTVQPGHLQKLAGRDLAPEERDELRSGIVKKKLKQVVLNKDVDTGKP
jgi:protein arginine kinase